MVRCLLALIGCIGCAKAGGTTNNKQPDAAQPTADAPEADAPEQHVDAPAGSCASPFSGMLATWNLTGQTGSQATTAATSSAIGVVAGALSRSSGLTAVSGANSINASNWPSAAQRDSTKYFFFTVAPPADCTLSITSLSIDAKSSATGPTMAVVATSQDTYGATSTVSTTAPSTPSLAVANVNGLVQIRVYGYSASSTSGTFRIENTLVVNGSIQ